METSLKELELQLAWFDHKAFVERKKLSDAELDRVWELKDRIDGLRALEKKVASVREKAVSGKWSFEHAVHYLRNTVRLPLQEINRLASEWDL